MAGVGSQFMGRSLPMKISSSSTPAQAFCQWQMLVLTPMVHNSSSQPSQLAGWMADMLFLERCYLGWMWSTRLKQKEGRVVHQRAEL
nr:peptidyl-prolyl cis-trans isomerase CYP20-1-like isoform X3 [Ipomoea batatas]